MKPYFRVIWNLIKCSYIRIFKCKNFIYNKILLLGYNTKLHLNKTSCVSIGKKVVSDGRCVIIADEKANITIGDSVYFNENMMISAKKSISIGNECKFGPNVKIFDNNHRFNKEQGVLNEHTSEAVTIGNKCWIATNVVILKGTTIGNNCIIGAGCVVKGNVPSYSIVTQEKTIKIVPLEEG